ncbi:MAG TPA: M50 family metallopeptidase [Pseudonocardia sp.]
MSDSTLAALAGLLALMIVWPHSVWRISRTAVTIAHEGGHALIAVLSGRRLSGIRLHSDTSGLTVSRGRPSGPGMIFTALAGYVAPSLLGLGASALVVGGYTQLLLVMVLTLLLATLFYVRNLYGGFAVVVTAVLIGLVGWYGDPNVRVVFSAGVAWFLLLGGLRAVAELRRARRRWPGSDADQLAELTRVPPLVWVMLFLTVALASLGLGGWLLLGDVITPWE